MRKNHIYRTVFLPVFLFFLHSLSAQTTRYVAPAISGTGDGSSWANATNNLQLAINNSTAGDNIFVMKGTFFLSAPISMKEGVKIYGSFAGTESGLGQRVFGPNASDTTVLDGQNARRVIYNAFAAGNAMTSASVLDGFKIVNGKSSGRGGGMYNQYASPTISNCSFWGNTAGNYGGGLCNVLSSSPIVSNCIFSKNVANNRGGGVNNEGSSPIFTNCRFTENTATTEFGGGLFNYNAAAVVSGCIFSKNNAVRGGGMFNQFSSLPAITNCIFEGNTVSLYGGGMYNESTSPDIVNALFSGNMAAFGPGLYNANSSAPVLKNCTFSANNGSNVIYNENTAASLYNCIVYGNTSGFNWSGTIGNSLVQGISGSANGNIDGNTDPLFVAPQPASAAPTTAGDYRLQSNSPVINAGSNALVPPGTTTDLAGIQRIVAGTVDMGAYEANNAPLPVVFGNISAVIKNNLLYVDWTTLTEINNDHFDIEVSSDGISFTQLASVKSKAHGGSSDTSAHYHFEINAPQAAASLAVQFILALCCITRRKIMTAFTVIALSFVLFSCSRKDFLAQTTTTKLYVRIVQTDNDGTKQYAKIITAIRDDR